MHSEWFLIISKPKSKVSYCPNSEGRCYTNDSRETRLKIWKALLPEMYHGPTKVLEPEEDSRWSLLTTEEGYTFFFKKSDNAPDEDEITGKMLKMEWKNQTFRTILFRLLQFCSGLGYHLKIWREEIIMVIPKPNKPGYTKPELTDLFRHSKSRQRSWRK